MGRPRKPTALLELQGTFRKDRHSNNSDGFISNVSPSPIKIDPPSTLTDKYVIDYWNYHINFLINLNIIQMSDIPELEIMYSALQKARALQVELDKLSKKGIIENIDIYEQLSKLYLKYVARFSQLASQYYISPNSRAKLTLDQLNIEKIKTENPSIMAKLLERKRA